MVDAAEQFNGREGETALSYRVVFLPVTLLGGGFPARHLKRYVASREQPKTTSVVTSKIGIWGQAYDSAILAGEPIAPWNSSMTRLKQHLLGTED